MKINRKIWFKILTAVLTAGMLMSNIQMIAFANETRVITYADGSKIIYTYSNGNVSSIDYYSAEDYETPLYNYQYSYNGNKINSVICSVSNSVSDETEKFKIVDEDNSYKFSEYIVKNGAETERLLYESNSSIFSQTESFYSCFGNIENKKIDTAVTLLRSNKLRDSMSFSIGKDFLGYNQIDYSVTSLIEKDGIGRIKSNSIDSNFANQLYPDNIGDFNHNMEYVYLDNGTDRSLVSEYTISGDMMENSALPETFTSTALKYNGQGMPQFKYYKLNEDNGTFYYLGNFYGYDSQNRLVIETDSINNKYIEYFYDENNNLYEKRIFGETAKISLANKPDFDIEQLLIMEESDFNKFDFSVFNNERFLIEDNQYYVYNYCFDPMFKDRMVEYTEKECVKNGDNIESTTKVNEKISYDACGNPLNYVVYTYEGLIRANLKWCGNLLTEFDVLDENGKVIRIFTYEYDHNGNRVAKKKYIRNNNDTFDLHSAQNFIWNNGILQCVIFKGNILNFLKNDNDYNQDFITYSKIIYDANHSPIAYITPVGAMYQYIKDFKGNIIGLQSTTDDHRTNNEDSSVFVEMRYDSYGLIDFYYPPKVSSDKYNSYMLTALFNPCTYKDYLYDYESGMYYAQNEYYSPLWGKNIQTT